MNLLKRLWFSPHRNLAAVFVLLGYFFFCKIHLFNNLAYTSDLFMFHQLSRTWLEKGKLLLENCYGGQLPIHNYFLMPLFYPFTWLWGAYGLFIVLWALSFFAVYRLFKFGGTPLVLFAFVLPVSFWVYDHHTYGFGVELLQVSVGLLFAISLVQKSWGRFLWGALIVLNKEDGAVLLASILLSHHVYFHGLNQRKNLVYKILLCIGLFAAGLAFQKTQGQRTSHVIEAFIRSLSNAGDWRNWIRGIKVVLLLTLPVFLLSFPKLWKKWLPTFLVSLSPLVIVAMVGNADYGTEDWLHGIHWPIRFALMWGLVLSSLFFLSHYNPKKMSKPSIALFFVGASVFQIATLAFYRKYSFYERLSPWNFKSTQPISQITSEEHAFFKCLAKNLPKRFPIAIEGPFFGYFHEQEIVWPDRLKYSSVKPDVFVCLKPGRFYPAHRCLNPLLEQKERLEILSTSWATLAVNPENLTLAETCLRDSELAN